MISITIVVWFPPFFQWHQIVVPIKSQTNLNQAVALMDHNPNAKSLRVYLTPLQSDTSTATASTPSSTTGTGSSAPGLGHSKSAGTIAYHDSISGGGDLYDTAVSKQCLSLYF